LLGKEILPQHQYFFLELILGQQGECKMEFPDFMIVNLQLYTNVSCNTVIKESSEIQIVKKICFELW